MSGHAVDVPSAGGHIPPRYLFWPWRGVVARESSFGERSVSEEKEEGALSPVVSVTVREGVVRVRMNHFVIAGKGIQCISYVDVD